MNKLECKSPCTLENPRSFPLLCPGKLIFKSLSRWSLGGSLSRKLLNFGERWKGREEVEGISKRCYDKQLHNDRFSRLKMFVPNVWLPWSVVITVSTSLQSPVFMEEINCLNSVLIFFFFTQCSTVGWYCLAGSHVLSSSVNLCMLSSFGWNKEHTWKFKILFVWYLFSQTEYIQGLTKFGHQVRSKFKHLLIFDNHIYWWVFQWWD